MEISFFSWLLTVKIFKKFFAKQFYCLFLVQMEFSDIWLNQALDDHSSDENQLLENFVVSVPDLPEIDPAILDQSLGLDNLRHLSSTPPPTQGTSNQGSRSNSTTYRPWEAPTQSNTDNPTVSNRQSPQKQGNSLVICISIMKVNQYTRKLLSGGLVVPCRGRD